MSAGRVLVQTTSGILRDHRDFFFHRRASNGGTLAAEGGKSRSLDPRPNPTGCRTRRSHCVCSGEYSNTCGIETPGFERSTELCVADPGRAADAMPRIFDGLSFHPGGVPRGTALYGAAEDRTAVIRIGDRCPFRTNFGVEPVKPTSLSMRVGTHGKGTQPCDHGVIGFVQQHGYRLGWMPTLLRTGPYRVHFYAQDRLEEPPHVHVRRDRNEAKF